MISIPGSTPVSYAAQASAATNATADAGSTDGGEITSKDFLTLLVTELQNQDPTQPQDPTQYVQQLVGVNSLQQLIGINQGINSLNKALGVTSNL